MKRTKSVTRLPDFVVRFLGKRDGHHGKESVCESYIKGYHFKMRKIITEATLKCDGNLAQIRVEAAELVNTLLMLNREKQVITAADSTSALSKASSIRKAQTMSNQLSKIRSDEHSIVTKLSKHQESIRVREAMLTENASAIKANAQRKASAYTHGVNKVIDFESETSFEYDDILNNYYAPHTELTEQITAVLNLYGGNTNEKEG